MLRKLLAMLVGAVFILGAVYFAVYGVSEYVRQLDARDWRIVMAAVTNVSEREEYTGGRHGRYVTVYDIDYLYNFNSDSYSGSITGSRIHRDIGDTFDVKCDPDSPEISTDILEPRPGVLLINLTGAGIFMTIGLWLVGLPALLRRKKSTGADRPRD